MKIRNINKKNLVLILLASMLLVQIPINASNKGMDISSWAKVEVDEAELYGLFNKSWFKNGFKQKISEENAKALLSNMDKKIALEVKKTNTTFKPIKVNNVSNKGDFLTSIYNILAKNNLIVDSKVKPIDSLINLDIIKGDGKNLNLDKKMTSEEAVVLAKRATQIAFEKLGVSSKGLVWEVNNKGNKVYLVGSIHSANSGIYPYSKELMDKFNSSDELYLEIDISDLKESQARVNKVVENFSKDIKYSDGRKLKDVVGNKLYGEIKLIMDKNKVPESNYESSQLWAVIQQINIFTSQREELITKAESSPYIVDYGIDMYFLNKAKESKKPIKELETIESQANVFLGSFLNSPIKDLPDNKQVEILEKVLNDFKNLDKKEMNIKNIEKNLVEEKIDINSDLTGMYKYWKEGDLKSFKELIDPQSDSALLGDRDKAMAKKISTLLEGKDKKQYFIVAGAAHYVKDGMVVDLLRDMGYEVKSLN